MRKNKSTRSWRNRSVGNTSTIGLKIPTFHFADGSRLCRVSSVCKVAKNSLQSSKEYREQARFKLLRDAAILEWRELITA